MKHLFLLLIVTLFAGCATTQKELAKTKAQAFQAGYESAAVNKATDKGDNHIAEFMSAMPESGAVGWCKIEKPAFDTAGKLITRPDGSVVFNRMESIGKSNSMRDLPAGVDEAYVKLGGVAVNPKTGEVQMPKTAADAVNSGGMLEGVFFWVKGTPQGTGSVMNAEFAAVWAGASVAEKQAAADAVAKYLEGTKNLHTAIIREGGGVATGVLRELGKATPYGAASAAVEAIITTDDGEEVKGRIIEPFRTTPQPTNE